MNILTSYNWLKEYLKTDLSPEDFASRVSLSGPGVERIYKQGENMDDIVVGKIINVAKHSNADKLKVVEVDVGPASRLLRGTSKKVEVVCGGSNLKSGMKVVVALPGAKVKWHGEGELVELKPTKIRGVESFGMICASEEIGLGSSFPAKSDGEIMDLGNLDAKPGTLLKKALKLDDVIFDIEITTNRPDAMCILGIAREAGTILKSDFSPPKVNPIKEGRDTSALKVKNESPNLCYRYQAVVIEGVKIKESPMWLKKKLASVGTRSINNVVDITNLILWEMAQPLHAFDYSKLQGKKLVIRNAHAGEKIKALDDLDYKLKDGQLVIADGKVPVAIAGVMGGRESCVDDNTSVVVLEAATFDPVSVRKTSRALNLRSESSALFEKGLSTESTAPALARAVELILELAGGVVKTKVFDEYPKKYSQAEVSVVVDKVNSILGVELEAEEMMDILKRLGFDTRLSGGILIAKVPYWRGDIEIGEDLIEEIARIYGYHRLPSKLPSGEIPNEVRDKRIDWERDLKNFAVANGFFEVYSYSFISSDMLESFGLKASDAVRLKNPLTEDLEFMRPSLLPGMLKIVSENENNFAKARIFELSRVYKKKRGDLPEEPGMFAGMVYGKSEKGELFYDVKGVVEELLQRFGVVGYDLKELKDKNYHPARSVSLWVGKEHLGDFGEIHPAVAKRFDINSRVGFFDLDFELLLDHLKSHKSYSKIPEYPGIKRDISFVIDNRAEYKDVESAILAVDPLVSEVELFDVYTPSVIPSEVERSRGISKGKKSMALHILFRSSHKTLETKVIDELWEKIVKMLKKDLKADVRS